MEDSRLVQTPMVTGHKLSKNDDSVEVTQTLFKSMIGKLQYVVHNRSTIALVVGIITRFSTNPRENHMTTVKKYIEIPKRNRRLWTMVQEK